MSGKFKIQRLRKTVGRTNVTGACLKGVADGVDALPEASAVRHRGLEQLR